MKKRFPILMAWQANAQKSLDSLDVLKEPIQIVGRGVAVFPPVRVPAKL